MIAVFVMEEIETKIALEYVLDPPEILAVAVETLLKAWIVLEYVEALILIVVQVE